MGLTAQEKALIREERARQQREWWARMSLDERRAKRDQYALNAIMNRKKKEMALVGASAGKD